ncbi:MAG TPA: TetR/AcrR family transcriptional regulator [Steroidobacteraceae bacterium]|nr:TetR/AcrR family transcriptional regulator [Steroidobacteraceae bacterium]
MVERQRRRRAEILGSARSQMAGGNTEINIKRLASDCDLAVQTVYNLVGDKETILRAATDEYFSEVLARVSQVTATCGCHGLLSDVLWYAAAQYPTYVTVLNLDYFSPNSCVRRIVQKRLHQAFNDWLFQVLPDDSASITRQQLAERAHALVSVSSFEWVNRCLSLDELRARIAHDLSLILKIAKSPS